MTALDTEQEQTWFTRLRDLDRACPWPGPRPLSLDDEELLVGRDPDRKDFRHEVDSHRLVVLAGVSGVGKTSLLDAGLRPELEKSGYTVVVCRDWARDEAGAHDAVSFLAGKVRAGLTDAEAETLPHGADFFWALEDRFGDRLVVVLDQFEELIRFDRDLKDDVLDLLVEINHRLPAKIIVSLRSEYLHELRSLENRATPYTLSRYVLDDLDHRYARAVVLAPTSRWNKPEPFIEEGLADEIARDWRAALHGTQDRLTDPFGRIGLLHLQALLYSLHAEVKGATVGAAAYHRMQEAAREGGHASVFTYGVVLAIHRKLQRCERAFKAEGVDDYRLAGVQSLLTRSVPKLASGGYKLVRSARDLLEEVLEAEIGVLSGGLAKSRQHTDGDADGPVSRQQLIALFEVVLARSEPGQHDLLSISRAELAQQADSAQPGGISWVDRLHVDASPDAADWTEVSCGPVSGLAPAAVLIEELRRFALMLAWLRATDLVRITSPGGGELMVSLIHDGFGEGLRQWAERRRRREPTADALHALTAPFGVFFDWTDEPSGIFDGGEGFRVLANLRWRGNTVKAHFRRVVFVSCDFRGTLFDECTFEGVTLVNCRLDGTLISDCTLSGPLPPATVEDRDEPQFLVDAEHNRLLPAMQHYQGMAAEQGLVLLAPHVGRPAQPAPLSAKGLPRVAPATGGLVVLGGRLSALTIRGTRFKEGTRLSFRQVAGSGLDLVEQRAGSLEVLGSALRHLTVTAPPKPDQNDEETLAEEKKWCFELTVRGSALFQSWIGDRVRGSGTIDDCRVVQFWNGSPNMALTITGGSLVESIGAAAGGDGAAPAPLAEDLDRAERMDYVRRSRAYLLGQGSERS